MMPIHVPFRIKLVLGILLLLGVFLAIMMLMNVLRTDSPQNSQVATEDLYLRPDMAITIPIIFDVNNVAATYDWALAAEAENAPETFVETTTFDIQGQSYEFLLATKKAQETDEEYTIPDYLALTLAVPNDSNVVDTIVYIDLGADGALDSVFLNDQQITNPAGIAEAQTQYSTEIVVARDHMLDSVSL
jgi:hypothetical protein